MQIAIFILNSLANSSSNQQISAVRAETHLVAWKSIGKMSLVNHRFSEISYIPNFHCSIGISGCQFNIVVKTNDR